MGLSNVLTTLGYFGIYAVVVGAGCLLFQLVFGQLPSMCLSKKQRIRSSLRPKGSHQAEKKKE